MKKTRKRNVREHVHSPHASNYLTLIYLTFVHFNFLVAFHHRSNMP